MKALLALSLLVILTSYAAAQTDTSTFHNGTDGWTGGFADYPAGSEVFYELGWARTTLPAPLDPNRHAFMITGNNHSDDLFMYLKKKISGLQPNMSYLLRFDVEFASNAPTGMAGVGGAPGEGVTVKCGATTGEPGVVIDGMNYVRMNIGIGNQANPGADMDTIGHVGVSDTTTGYTIITRSNASHLFSATTDANGNIWVIIGTDSGFEATTTLYYTQILITFSNPTPVELATFSARRTDGRTILEWITESESENLGFEIQRAVDTSPWQVLGFIPGDGTSTERRAYRFVDADRFDVSVMERSLWYRLRQVDFDGSFSFSPVVEVTTGKNDRIPELLAPYPSPASGASTVTILLSKEETVSLTVFDLLGAPRITICTGLRRPAGAHSFALPTDQLPSGPYVLLLSTGSVTAVRTFSVLR